MRWSSTNYRYALELLAATIALIWIDAYGPATSATPTTPSAPAKAAEICTGATGSHVMFLMFLNAPPRIPSPDWVLQSTTTMDFETCEACAAAAQSVANSIIRTPTINLVGWCFAKEPANASSFLRSQKTGPGGAVPLTPPLNLRPQR
ncbi:hypothetical protein [Bradyrhizobium sp. SZCCHNRI2007]|uniref:hypothetical protein n=1 Tax=Bradyrhizobium sp. SZCCHNRI2007 TaxID=3057281 RepID=UPI0028E41F94|nr:hypothetical protein [Bradyrhizobium sp. SZCCHNRI2007]